MSDNSSYKEYNAVDILKLVLAVLVMIIHSGIDKTVISPALRTAVPLFFIISAYFFFLKIENLQSGKEKNMALLKLVRRNLLLYLFWATVQLPLLFFMRGYHKQGVLLGLCSSIKDILFGSGFTGAWYIVALAGAMAVIFLLSKKISPMLLVFLTMPFYIICCLLTNYGNLFDGDSVVWTINKGYRLITQSQFHTSLPAALFWISIGRFLAVKKIKTKSSILVIFTVLFGTLLGIERYLIVKYGLAQVDDCYFMLILFCPAMFLLVNKCTAVYTGKLRIRELSVLIYVIHGCCERVVGYVLKLIPLACFNNNVVKIIISFLIIVLISKVLIYLKEKRNIRILKYAF